MAPEIKLILTEDISNFLTIVKLSKMNHIPCYKIFLSMAKFEPGTFEFESRCPVVDTEPRPLSSIFTLS